MSQPSNSDDTAQRHPEAETSPHGDTSKTEMSDEQAAAHQKTLDEQSSNG